MDAKELPAHPNLEQYKKQAKELAKALHAGEDDAIRRLKAHHLQARTISDLSQITLSDAQFVLAREYGFESWPKFSRHIQARAHENSPISQFEAAVDAGVNGNLPLLKELLRENPGLIRERSTRVHQATLLHYVSANGVEDYRQKSPPNAVEIARLLLEAGAKVDARAEMYGERCTTMTLLVSSAHPAKAGVQCGLIEVLLDFGAAIDDHSKWGPPLLTALAFGYREAAETLARHGARTDRLAAVAGLGRLEEAKQLLPQVDELERHRALALAAQHGQTEVVRLLLDAGEDPNRYNPEGHHSHSTPLHQAALAGHETVVRLLVERGAKLDIRDKIYHATPRDWARHGGQSRIEEYLAARETNS
jgi:hypothetical protein